MENQLLIASFVKVKSSLKFQYTKRPAWLPNISHYDELYNALKYCNEVVYKLICSEFLTDKKINILINRFINCKEALHLEGDLDVMFQLYYVELLEDAFYRCMQEELYESVSNLTKFSDKIGECL